MQIYSASSVNMDPVRREFIHSVDHLQKAQFNVYVFFFIIIISTILCVVAFFTVLLLLYSFVRVQPR